MISGTHIGLEPAKILINAGYRVLNGRFIGEGVGPLCTYAGSSGAQRIFMMIMIYSQSSVKDIGILQSS